VGLSENVPAWHWPPQALVAYPKVRELANHVPAGQSVQVESPAAEYWPGHAVQEAAPAVVDVWR
jgi:hypothetical protein